MKKLDYLGFTVCPLRHNFQDSFQKVVEENYLAQGIKFDYLIPSGCDADTEYDDIWRSEDIEDIPSVVMGVGFNNFFRAEFVERLASKGYFSAGYGEKINPAFSPDFLDPDGWYRLYAAFPHVFLVDHKKLGNLPAPKSWKDILDPIYANNIVVHGDPQNILDVLLLYTYRDYGEEGLVQLAHNVKDAWHPSRMAKIAGSSGKEGAAIFIIPWFFAKTCQRTKTTSIIWPEEGAITSPMFLLVKDSKKGELKPVTDFITGETYGQFSADNYFPVLNLHVNNNLPAGAKLQWLGWNLIKTYPVDKLQVHLASVFHFYWEKELQKRVNQDEISHIFRTSLVG